MVLLLKSRLDSPPPDHHNSYIWPEQAGIPLTKEVGVHGYGYRESISWFMDPEEDHGHILGESDAPSAKTTLTEICIPLSCGERMILRTVELFFLENPTIKYLPTKKYRQR